MNRLLTTLLSLILGCVVFTAAATEPTYRVKLAITSLDEAGQPTTESKVVELEDNLPMVVVETKEPVALKFNHNARGQLVGTVYRVDGVKLTEVYVFSPDDSDLFSFMDFGLSIQLYFGEGYMKRRSYMEDTEAQLSADLKTITTKTNRHVCESGWIQQNSSSYACGTEVKSSSVSNHTSE